MTIGQRLRTARESKNMTLDEVAQCCNTTKQTIFKYENEIVTNIPYEKIVLLLNALDISPSYLFGWAEKDPPDQPELTEGEKELLNLYRMVPVEQQPLVLSMIKVALGQK